VTRNSHDRFASARREYLRNPPRTVQSLNHVINFDGFNRLIAAVRHQYQRPFPHTFQIVRTTLIFFFIPNIRDRAEFYLPIGKFPNVFLTIKTLVRPKDLAHPVNDRLEFSPYPPEYDGPLMLSQGGPDKHVAFPPAGGAAVKEHVGLRLVCRLLWPLEHGDPGRGKTPGNSGQFGPLVRGGVPQQTL
jgi:hypothetical protein